VSRGLDRIDGVAGLLAGPANVVMQLSRPEVGYGVLESKVHSGKITEHPIKRGRTTFTYLAVATMGRDADRRRYRRAVDSAHAAVRSGPDSPVEYNAFDPELQLWVGACTAARPMPSPGSGGRSTTKPPMSCTGSRPGSGRPCRSPPRCGPPTGPLSSGIGRPP
jgi:hypothetical protein